MGDIRKFDVIVVGFGDAGAAAAIEAADNGARVLVLDRSYGGGASALSGGVVYAGGGTAQQQANGYDDTPENLFNYLQQEVGDAVDEATLRRFCAASPATIPWLEAQGASFASSLAPYKTSYPTDEHYLYFSGNEKAYPYNLKAEPAPRGHRALASGLASGRVLWEHLRRSALRKGVTFIPLARVRDLVIRDGRVVGVKYRVLPEAKAKSAGHEKYIKRGGKLGNWSPPLGKRFTDRADAIWDAGAVEEEAHAEAVILAAGGFIYNPDWVAKYAPEFRKISPLGTIGDDGAGIQLGIDVGGKIDKMGNVTAWRFLSPPSAFIEGITVGMDGTRIANEDLYGATHGDVLMRRFGGSGWAIYDSTIWTKARKQVRSQTHIFQRLQAIYTFTAGHKKARTLAELAHKTGIAPAGLRESVAAYNAGVTSGDGDPAHKGAEYCAPLVKPPYYAFNISAENAAFLPLPGLTLGGLVVDGESGLVVHRDGGTIPGLYAAGRNAVGICSNSYISGLSLADCIFTGRRAGAHAARTSGGDAG